MNKNILVLSVLSLLTLQTKSAFAWDEALTLSCNITPNAYSGWRTEVKNANAVETGAVIDLRFDRNDSGRIVRSEGSLRIIFSQKPGTDSWREINEVVTPFRVREVSNQRVYANWEDREEYRPATVQEIDLSSSDGQSYAGQIFFDSIFFDVNCSKQ
jgi:hypothetical protein